MSASIKLRKTYGIIWMIVSFILLVASTCCVWILLHSSSPYLAFIVLPIMLFATFCVIACSEAYASFVKAGRYQEEEKQKKKRNRSIFEELEEEEDNEEDDETEEEEITDSATLEDAAQLHKTYGILYLVAAFVLSVGVIFLNLYLFSIDWIFILFLAPESFIFVLIYVFFYNACAYFMDTGMYLEKHKQMQEFQ